MKRYPSPAASLGFILLAALVAAGAALAQDWPARSIRFISHSPPGTSDDMLARLIAQRLSERFGQPFVVENRPGANGNIGIEALAKSAPDGYSLGLSTTGPLANNRLLYKSMPFDPVKDLAPIILIGEIPLIALEHPGVQARNLRELADLARSRPGKLNAGSFGNGSIAHLALELFKTIAKVDLVHVPYKSSPVPDFLAGNIQVMFVPPAAYVKHVQAGTLRALAVTAQSRFAALPDLQTAKEQGFDVQASIYYSLVGPAGIPRPVVDKLNQEVNQYIASPEFRGKLAELWMQAIGGPPERVTAMMASETGKWKRIIDSTGVKLD